MLWNYHDDDIAAEPARVKLSISGLPMQGKFKAVEYLMDAKHSNAYAAWQEMGSPLEPTEKQFRRLRSVGSLHSEIFFVPAVEKDRIEVPVTLQRQEVMLVELTW
jgi:xylan 1,4-beta-xylosidase